MAPAPFALAAPSSSATRPPSPPWARHTFEVGDQAVSLCLPNAPSASQKKDFDSTHFNDLSVATDIGDVAIELMGGTSGPYPMESNLPDETSTDELVRKEQISRERWLFTTRERKDGMPRVTSRIPDAYGEDMICMASGRPTQDAVGLTAGFAIIERICRSLEMASDGGPASQPPCDPPGNYPHPPTSARPQ